MNIGKSLEQWRVTVKFGGSFSTLGGHYGMLNGHCKRRRVMIKIEGPL